MHSVNQYDECSDELKLDKFVQSHHMLVKKIALFIKRKLPSHIEFNDLLQSGLVGLLEARTHYKNDMGTTFETYASIRIRGAIIDSLRKNSWVSRETIKNMRLIADAIKKIEQHHQKQATTEDIIKELGVSLEEYMKISQDVSVCNIMSLNDLEEDYSIISDDSHDPQEETQQYILQKKLKEVLMDLPEKEQLILSLYYIEELTFKQIGEVLELTEARICQLHSQAIARVRIKIKQQHTAVADF